MFVCSPSVASQQVRVITITEILQVIHLVVSERHEIQAIMNIYSAFLYCDQQLSRLSQFIETTTAVPHDKPVFDSVSWVTVLSPVCQPL